MERTEELQKFDRSICAFYEKYSNAKNDDTFCYKPDKKSISSFYGSMNDNFMRNKLRINQQTKRLENSDSRMKERLLESIKNPLVAALPKQIEQLNEINFGQAPDIKMQKAPMFSGVEGTKKGAYVIGKEVRQIVSEDIQNMVHRKEEQLFRRKFPPQKSKQIKEWDCENGKTEKMIKSYNRILSKYRNRNPTAEAIKLIDQNNFPEIVDQLVLDNQFFNVVDLFKKLYNQNRSQLVNDGLMKYILKFQKYDKLTKKLKTKNNLHKRGHSRQSICLASSGSFKENKNDGSRRLASTNSLHSDTVYSQKLGNLHSIKAVDNSSNSTMVRFKARAQSFKPGMAKVERLRLRL